VCVKEAKAVRTQAVADAKVKRKTAEAAAGQTSAMQPQGRQRAKERAAEMKEEAAQDVREAKTDLAEEQCDRLAGDAKERCLERTRARPTYK
jgi:hypothetical protein